MPVEEANLDLALGKFEKSIDRQFSSIDWLSTKTGVVLGLVLTFLIAIFSLGSEFVRAQPVFASATTVLLLASGGLLAYSYAARGYASAPEASWFLGLLDLPNIELKRRLVANLSLSIRLNRVVIRERSRLFNFAIAFFIIGAVALVIGGLLS